MRRETLLMGVAAVFLAAAAVFGQGIITTVAGSDFFFPRDPIPALQAPLGAPVGLALNSRGELFISDNRSGHILRLSPDGLSTIAAGSGLQDYLLSPAGEGGPAQDIPLSPDVITFDDNDNLYLIDSSFVRRIDTKGIISTVAGRFDRSRPAQELTPTDLDLFPTGIGLDAAGNLYILDGLATGRVLRVSPAGSISRIAGPDRSLVGHGGLVVDRSGNIFVSAERIISRITPSGDIIRLQDLTAPPGNRGAFPIAITPDPLNGGILAADPFDSIVLRITPDGVSTRIAGVPGVGGYAGDGGLATQANFWFPNGIAADAKGNIFVSDTTNRRIRKIDANGVVTTIAGTGLNRFSGDGGPAISAVFDRPYAMAFDSAGNLFVTDRGSDRIRKISTENGIIRTFAENLVEPSFLRLSDLAIDASDSTYTNLEGIQRFTPAGARSVFSRQPVNGLAVEASGNILAAAQTRILRFSPSGSFVSVAGNGTYGFSGDNGPATSAQLLNPAQVRADRNGNVYFIDQNGDRIRVVNAGGTIRAFAGPGNGIGFAGDGGPATAAQLSATRGLAIDAAGNVYFSQGTFGGHRIRRVSPDGIVSLVAGGGSPFFGGFLGDGAPAVEAALSEPAGMVFDRQGNLLFADSGNNRIRMVLAGRPSFAPLPQRLDFSAASNGAAPKPQTYTVTSDVVGITIVNQPETRTGGAWLSVTPIVGASPRIVEVRADPTNVPPGTHQGLIRVRLPDATPVERQIAVTFAVSQPERPKLSVESRSFSFTYPRQGVARVETFNVFNRGGGSLPFTVEARTDSGGNWLSASATAGTATPQAPVTCTVMADPAALPVGTYTGRIIVAASTGEVATIAVTTTVSALDHVILLSQTGLSFTAVEGGGAVPQETFGVLNLGRSAMNWAASVPPTLAGGAWLSASPAVGVSVAGGNVPIVEVRVNASTLPEGVYHGLVRIDAPGAANSPQVVAVTLEVLKAGSNPPAVVVPNELIFQALAGDPLRPAGSTPAAQEVLVYNLDRSVRTFRALRSVGSGMLWFSVLPETGTLDPASPTRIIVQPTARILGPGIFHATLSFQFVPDGRVSEVKITFVVSPRSPDSLAMRQPVAIPQAVTTPRAAGCIPGQLLPTLVTLGGGFTVSAGIPVALVSNVLDDCGEPLERGSVAVEFSNGDAPLLLTPLRGGRWDGTWYTQQRISDVSLRIRAVDESARLTGVKEIEGALRSPQDPPLFASDAVVSAAGPESFAPLAPGGFIAIFGERLSEGQNTAATLPLPSTLGGTTALIAGRQMPLQFTSDGQVNAIVPQGININTRHQVLIRRGNTYSRPVSVDVAAAQPAVFSASDSKDSRQGHIYRVGETGNLSLAAAGSPASSGEAIILYCAGLGEVNPSVEAGSPGPAQEPLSRTVQPVSITIGGVDAQVVFSGFAPGYAGVYQVNAVVPQGIPGGPAVPVILRIAGQQSPPVTMAVQ